MKVLVITNVYPSVQEPTRGIFNQYRLSALSERCEVRVVAPVTWWNRLKDGKNLLSAPTENIKNINSLYPTYWSIPTLSSLHGYALYISLRRYIRHISETYSFDLIFAVWAYPDALASALLTRDYGCPLVIQVMGSDINELSQRPRIRRQIVWALKQSHRTIAVSRALRDRVVELGAAPENVVVQHNGVDGDLFQIGDRNEARLKLGLPTDRKLILYIGNFRLIKGSDLLVEAMVDLIQLHSDADLLLVGSGDMERALQLRVESLGLGDRVRFYGRQDHPMIPLWMQACDVFCLPSRNEGCPNVVLEALASGRPVVASNVGGIPELLDADNGILVPSEDPASLAAGLSDALQRDWDPVKLRNSVEFLSWSDIGESYFQVLSNAMNEFHARKGERS
jgi:glycosyltransferase involved in cell wall biosynthesis